MQPPLPSLTTVWHNETYATISPTRPELSAAGKTVVITGAGSGLGRAIALSFSRAQASRMVLLGRNENNLQETQRMLSCTSTSVHPVSVTDEETLNHIAATVGTWDVLVLAAGYASTPALIQDTDTEDWWECFETNVKGTMVPSKVFLPTANPSTAAIIALTSGPVVYPPAIMPAYSAYFVSKLALQKLIEFIGAGNPGIFTAALHPGMVDTALFRKSGAEPGKVPVDKPELSGDFTVWLASPEASFLTGRVVWANWDVQELQGMAEKIQSGLLLTSGAYGWPFGQ
ncbi:hypothetical protein BDW62DRAFT_213422 [Aspergillus aurantiobrunneus]